MGQSGTVPRAHGESAGEPGSGGSGERSEPTFREDVPEPSTRQNISCPQASKPSRAPRAAEAARPAFEDGERRRAAAMSPTEPPPPESRRTVREHASRPAPVRVDEVGGAAMTIAARTRRAPRLVRSALDPSRAPLDPQSAYVLSLVDGQIGVETVADIAGVSIELATAILERLERLGLVVRH